MSLKLKLVAILISLSLIPLCFVGILGFSNAKTSMEESQVEKLQNMADLKAGFIQVFFSERKADVDMLRNNPIIKSGLPVLDRLNHVRSDPAHLQIKMELDRQAAILQRNYGYTDVLLLNMKGDTIYHAGGEPIPENEIRRLVNRENVIPTSRDSGIFFSQIFEQPGKKNLYGLLGLAAVFDDSREQIGTVVLGIDMGPIYGLIQSSIGLGSSGESIIGQLVDNDVVFLTPLRHDPQNGAKAEVLFPDSRAIPMREALKGHNGFGFSTDYRGQEVLAVWRSIPEFKWGLVAKIDTAEAFASVNRLKTLIVILALTTLATVILVGLSFIGGIIEPIHKLIATTRKIGAGDLTARNGITGTDEVGQLALAVDRMTANLQKITVSHAELASEVKERQKAEANLRAERDRAQQYLDIAGVVIMAIDERGEVSLINQDGCKLLGYPQSEIIGKNWFDHFLPEYQRVKVKTVFSDLMNGKTGGPEYHENIIMTRGGRQRLLAWHNTVLKDGSGRVVGTLSSGEDITDRKRTEKRLRESENQLKKVLANMPVMMDAFDENMNICTWNRQCEIITGYSTDEIIDNPKAMDLLYPDERYRIQMMDEWAARTDDYLNWEWDIICKNGEKKTIAWSNISARVPIPGWKSWGIGVDVTERNRALSAIEHSLKEKEVLLQEIHHRVKNNMQMIISLLKLQAAGMEYTPYHDLITESQNRIRSMALLHEKLYQSGDLVRIDFKKYVRDLISSLKRSYDIRPDKVAIQIRIDDIRLGMDAAISCGLIINELISNSVKHAFSEKSKGCITVSLYETDEDQLELTVADDGIGLPRDFDFMAAETLGLRLIAMLAEDQLDGSARFSSEKGVVCAIKFADERKTGLES